VQLPPEERTSAASLITPNAVWRLEARMDGGAIASSWEPACIGTGRSCASRRSPPPRSAHSFRSRGKRPACRLSVRGRHHTRPAQPGFGPRTRPHEPDRTSGQPRWWMQPFQSLRPQRGPRSHEDSSGHASLSQELGLRSEEDSSGWSRTPCRCAGQPQRTKSRLAANPVPNRPLHLSEPVSSGLTVTHIFLLWAKDLISLADLAASGGGRGTGHAR